MQLKTKISKELDEAIRLSLEKYQTDLMNKINDEFQNMTLSTTANSTEFSSKDFEEVMENLKNFPPIATEIQVFPSAYFSMFASLKKINIVRNEEINKDNGFISRFPGIRIVVIADDPELKENQARIIYNKGDDKIIDIY